jgi:hypothetical protein
MSKKRNSLGPGPLGSQSRGCPLLPPCNPFVLGMSGKERLEASLGGVFLQAETAKNPGIKQGCSSRRFARHIIG